MTNVQVERGYLTQSLGSASHSGEHGFKTVPGLLRLAREKEAWKERVIVQTGEHFEGYATFEEYVRGNPPKGLGTDMETLKRLVVDDIELRDWIDIEMARARPKGGDRKSDKAKEIKGLIQSFDQGQNEAKRDRSNEILRRLRKDFPDLHKQVLCKEITITEAAIRAKIYPPRIAVNLRDPESAANTLLTHASPEFLESLKKLLDESDEKENHSNGHAER
jgi:hypothetical protein